MKFKNINLIQSVSVLGQKSPGPLDVLCQVYQVGGSRVGGDDPLQSAPLVLNGVQVTGLPHPDKNRNARLLQPGKDGACRVAGSTILHKDGAASLGHGTLQMGLQHLPVHLGIHLGIRLDKVEVTQLAIAKGSPDHKLGRMLDRPGHEARMVSGDGGRTSDSLADLGAFPQFNVGLIRPKDFGPLCPGPVLVPVGPVRPPELLCLCQEGLLGSSTAGEVQLLQDDTLDGPLGDVSELWDLLLEAKWSDEGIPHDLLLHLSLHSHCNLATMESGAGIRLPLGWPGQATVSCSIPGPGLLGILLPTAEGSGWDLQVLRHVAGRHARLQHIQSRHLRRIASVDFLAFLLSSFASSFGSFSSCSSLYGKIATHTITEDRGCFYAFFRLNPAPVATGR